MADNQGMRNLKLVIEYDGSNYSGWQIQPDTLTIQGAIEGVLARITQGEVKLIASGRTDAGVHALNQVANFFTDSAIALAPLHRGINALLPKDIVVKEIEEEDLSFHARFSAKGKVYLYRLLNSCLAKVFERTYSWHISAPLAIERMQRASVPLLGRHDFRSFSVAGGDVINYVRLLKRLEITRKEDIVEIEIEADAFLRQMVRALVGTLAQVGLGKIGEEQVGKILMARERGQAGPPAPPQGLFLKRVYY